MKVSILGTGEMGNQLGKAWLAKGHDVIFGTSDKESESVQRLEVDQDRILSMEEAIRQSSIIVIAVAFERVQEIAQNNNWDNKIIVDATPAPAPLENGFASSAEAIASWANSQEVVRIFNNQNEGHVQICGDDPEAKRTVSDLAKDLDLEVTDLGGLEEASKA